jgi:hypothetical protein
MLTGRNWLKGNAISRRQKEGRCKRKIGFTMTSSIGSVVQTKVSNVQATQFLLA